MMYECQGCRSYRINDEGERELMAMFQAEIIEETRYLDGRTTETILVVKGEMPPVEEGGDPIQLEPVRMKASDFSGLGWVLPAWGVRAVVAPGYGVKEDLRTCIQMRSNPKKVTIYRHTGWTTIDGQRTYIHSGGGINERGNEPKIRVELPAEIGRYSLSVPENPQESIRASLRLTKLGQAETFWTLLAATITPLYGAVDFCVHLTGRTGTFKSEIMSLFQSHYGRMMDARHLPGSWSSTPNALEAQAWMVKDAVFVCDDFIPSGTSWQQKAYQNTADKIVRSQGNQAGRARLTDTSNLQTTMHPRGVILSTGEDTPEGHSVRARMLIMEMSPGEVDAADLTLAQRERALYEGTIGTLAKMLAKSPVDLTERTEELRDEFREIGHNRTPSTIGRLIATVEDFLDKAEEVGAISEREHKELEEQAREAIKQTGLKQKAYMESADPCQVFCSTIRHIFGAGLGHVRTTNGGIPRQPRILGWTEEGSTDHEFPSYRSHGPCIGWVRWDQNELYIDGTTGLSIIKKVAGGELSQTSQTLMKRLKDAGMLTRVDESRQRNTVRLTAENHPRQVLALNLKTVLQTTEEGGDE